MLQPNHILPASFRPLLGQATLGSVSLVEFLSDRQLEFHSADAKHQTYQDEAGILNPLLRDNPSLQEEVKAWLKQQKVQEIFTQGKYSLNGLRVKVYRQDSATQWFTGIITQHDQQSRTMIVMNDQVLEPQNVDPSLVQMMFIDDVVNSLLSGESITARRRPRTNKQNKASSVHPRGQSNSPGPIMKKQSNSSCTPPISQSSDCSMPGDNEDDEGADKEGEDRTKEEVRLSPSRERRESSKSKNKQAMSKRRKGGKEEGEEETLEGAKRLKGSNLSECSRSVQTSSPNLGQKGHHNKALSKKDTSESPVVQESWTVKNQPSDCKVDEETTSQSANDKCQEMARLSNPSPCCNGDPGTARTHGEMEEVNDRSEGLSHSEDSEAVSALLAYQESERLVSMETSECVVFGTLPGECELAGSDLPSDTEAKSSEFTAPEVSESAVKVEEQQEGSAVERTPSMPSIFPACTGIPEKPRPLEDSKLSETTNHCKTTPCPSPPTDLRSKPPAAKGTGRPGQNLSSEHRDRIKESSSPSRVETKTQPTPSPKSKQTATPNHTPNPTPSPIKSFIHTPTAAPPKTQVSHPVPTKSSTPALNRSMSSTTPTKTPAPIMSRSQILNPTPTKTPTAAVNQTPAFTSTKSPFIIDRNEPFTVYRDPALLREDPDTPQHHSNVAYIHPSTHTVHTPLPAPRPLTRTPPQPPHTAHATLPAPRSTHTSSLSPPNTHTPHVMRTPSPSPQTTLTSLGGHVLPSRPPHPSSLSHPHLLPTLLPGLPPSAALLAGHGSLGAMGLSPHPLPLSPNPSLLGQAPLGLYPLLWPPYPNGAHPYGPLGLQAAKWTHPESMCIAEGALKRNTPSPWLPQTSVVEGQGLRTPVPVRPASADPQRSAKSAPRSSPISKSTEELERKSLAADPLCGIVPVQLKADRSRSVAGKGIQEHTHCTFLPDPLPCRPKPSRGGVFEPHVDRSSRYQEESRRILQESIEVAPFTAKLHPSHSQDRDPLYARMHSQDREREMDLQMVRVPRAQHSTQSNYYTSLSSSVANEPPRRQPPAAELSSAYDRPNSGGTVSISPSFGISSSQATPKVQTQPPPLVKRHPENEAGLITERLTLQASSLESAKCRKSLERGISLPPSSSSSHVQPMPSLYRAPIFHPPAPPIPAQKELGHSRLSPPTLTREQPVNLAGKTLDQKRPPTLQPELRRHTASAAGRQGTVVTPVKSMHHHKVPDAWRTDQNLLRPSNGLGATKQQSAMASVIVRPASSKDLIAGEHSASNLKPSERGRMAGDLRSGTNSKEGSVQYKRGILWTPLDSVHCPLTTTGKTDHMNTSVNMATGFKAHTMPTVVSSGSFKNDPMPVPWRPGFISGQHQKKVEGSGIAKINQNPISSSPSTTSCPTTCHSAGDFLHLKKHRAALAATLSRNNTPTHTAPASQSSSTLSTHTPEVKVSPVKRPRQAGGPQEAPPRLTNGQTPPQTQTGKLSNPLPQQSNCHKLKKAWLTRHSEEDRSGTTAVTSTAMTAAASLAQQCGGEVISHEDRMSSHAERKTDSNDRKFTMDDRKGAADIRFRPDVQKSSPEDGKGLERGNKRKFDSSTESDSGGDSGNESESRGGEQRSKRQSKPTFKKKQIDLHKTKGENEKEEEEVKPNGTFRSAKEKSKLRMSNGNGIPRSVLKDWRKVRKLKQSGEAFLQDDACAEIGPNIQKCRECRVDRTRKAEEPATSPVFCRFYYFRRLSYSKNGVVRVDGFSVPELSDEEAVRVWTVATDDEDEDKNQLDLEMAQYILAHIGDKFCHLVRTENAAATWIKKDTQMVWKRAVRGVREMCDACEATLFNIHWACHKCGFVVCMDCYKARERKSARDKELYAWFRCVKNQPHDLKNLMPTHIVPGEILADLVNSMHTLREKFSILSHCGCTGKQNNRNSKMSISNGVSQVLDNILKHSGKHSGYKHEKPENKQSHSGNGTCGGDSDGCFEAKQTPPESQSPLHFLADLAEQKSREERKGGKSLKPDQSDHVEAVNGKCADQGSTLRHLLTSTASKLCLGSTDAGIAFAPVYNNSEQMTKPVRSMPNILDDIIASVVENKIPASKMAEHGLKQDVGRGTALKTEAEPIKSEKEEKPLDAVNKEAPHEWLGGDHSVLWLRNPLHQGNQKIFSEYWRTAQPVLISGLHKMLTLKLWKPEAFSREFSGHHGDMVNCRDGTASNEHVKEFWEGFEDPSRRPKSAAGEPAVYRLKDWPSGDEFLTLMPSRYDDVMRNLPLAQYCDPEGCLNLASRLPAFFIRPDLGPRLCCAYGAFSSPEQDFGTCNLHIEVSDIISVLTYVGVAKGNGNPSKSDVLQCLECEDLEESVKKRLKDPAETPGALWHIYTSKDTQTIQEFLQKVWRERTELRSSAVDGDGGGDSEAEGEADLLREGSCYLTPALRLRLQQEHGVHSHTLLQFHGDAVILPAGALHQVLNLHSCVQVITDFVSPEHAHNSYYLTQELRSSKDLVNYEDKLQVKNILYHSVKDVVAILKRCSDTQDMVKAEEEGKEDS
uniref:JmjC domain-containing protein n=1 Tax=Denticeps clupeoides TaxID=299321 RepID=A0AAY4EQD1_9TELE